PIWLAMAVRGKLTSRVTSRTQTGCFEVHTRPGNPSPGLNFKSSLTARNWSEALMVVYHAGLHSRCEASLLGGHACPSAQPVASQIVRNTSASAESRSEASLTASEILCRS